MFGKFTDLDGQKAKRNFVLGERSLRAYFAGGNVRFLTEAESNLSQLKPGDKEFDGALFYLGVAKTQLRKTQESIKIFEDLRERAATTSISSRKDFEGQISLQLAYAHIKGYTEDGYRAAEDELTRTQESAAKASNSDLELQSQSLQAFLYAVMAGRSDNEAERPNYARKAISLSESILASVEQSSESSRAVRFEALNALGIAWMRIGKAEWSDFPHRRASWANAESYYHQALEVIPNSVRSLQNLALLRLLQMDFVSSEEKTTLLKEARAYCERSLEVSDQDQYPYYLLAKVALAEADGDGALDYIRQGRGKPGAVANVKWAVIEEKAIAVARK